MPYTIGIENLSYALPTRFPLLALARVRGGRQGINEGKADEWLALTTRNVVGPGARELPPSTRKTVEGRALEWVRRNRGMLPRLALPPPSAHTAGGGVGGGSGVAGGKART